MEEGYILEGMWLPFFSLSSCSEKLEGKDISGSKMKKLNVYFLPTKANFLEVPVFHHFVIVSHSFRFSKFQFLIVSVSS